MFKIPSLRQLATGFASVLKRFPVVMAISLVGSVAFMLFIEVGYDELNSEWLRELYSRIILTSILGLTLSLSVALLVEQQQLSQTKAWLAQLAVMMVLVALSHFLHPIDFVANAFRFGFLIVAFHLMVSFAPFLKSGSVTSFWEYNKQLFLRILLSGLYSTVLYAGLCIAILSTNLLFNLKLDGEIYGHLAAVVYGLFNTAFFLAGIPTDWKSLEQTHAYPKGLKIFTQFVLIPLATIYLAILLAYELKVIVDWSLPKGLVASLVLGYAVYGILSILLVYPIRHDSDNRWISTFSRLFYVLLIPLIILLALAIYWRVSEYGITESRYVLVVLSVWLTGITVYFLFSKAQNIKVIPVSLCTVALLCTWGPQSANSLSIQSQTNQLIQLFEKNNAFTDNKLEKLADSVSSDDVDRARDIVNYLVDREGLKPLKPYLIVSLDSLEESKTRFGYGRRWRYKEELQKVLGIQYRYDRDYEQYTALAMNDTISVKGYDSFIRVSFYSYERNAAFDADTETLTIKTANDNIVFPLSELFARIKENNRQQLDKKINDLYIRAESDKAMYRLEIKTFSFYKRNGRFELNNVDGYLLIDYR